MAVILVDYENVKCMDGVEYLNSDDYLHIFYSNTCNKFPVEDLEAILKTNCKFKLSKLVNRRKNALDFYIATECGAMFGRDEHEILIISRDSDFYSTVEYLEQQYGEENISIFVDSNIKKGLMKLSNTSNSKNRRERILNDWYTKLCNRHGADLAFNKLLEMEKNTLVEELAAYEPIYQSSFDLDGFGFENTNTYRGGFVEDSNWI